MGGIRDPLARPRARGGGAASDRHAEHRLTAWQLFSKWQRRGVRGAYAVRSRSSFLWLVVPFRLSFLPARFAPRRRRHANADVPPRPGPLDARLPKAPLDLEVQVAPKGARAIAHFDAPDDQLQLKHGIAKFIENDPRLGLPERCRMCARNFGQDLAGLRYIAIDRDGDPDAKAHPRIAVAPVDYRLFD